MATNCVVTNTENEWQNGQEICTYLGVCVNKQVYLCDIILLEGTEIKVKKAVRGRLAGNETIANTRDYHKEQTSLKKQPECY